MTEQRPLVEIAVVQEGSDRVIAGLWTTALESLTSTEQYCIRSRLNTPFDPSHLLALVQTQRVDTWKKRLSVKRRNGERVFIYDIFGKIAKWIQKFIAVGDVAMQYDPAHAALPWAAVRFVLQVCISDVQRCAFILESIEQISEIITWSRVHGKIYLEGDYEATTTLKSALTSLYACCWSALAKVVLYFDQHKLRRVLSSVFETEKEASDDMARLEEHRNRVDRTASLITSETLFKQDLVAQKRHQSLVTQLKDMQTPIERIEKITDKSHEILVTKQQDQVLNSISNIPYVSHHKEIHRKVLQSSGKWLLDSSVTQMWLSSSSSQMLWLHGIIGSGKSCLVSIMIEHLLEQARADRIPDPAYFYCSRNSAEVSRANPNMILRSILRQLADPRSSDAMPCRLIDESRSLSNLALEETVDLIIEVAGTRPVTHILIDGLDECDADLVFEIIDGFEAILGRTESLLKIFVSSRNDLDLVRWLQDHPKKEILSSDNQNDIDRYVNVEVDKRIDGPTRRFRPRKVSDDLREHIKATLKAEANGMFRWVELQLQYIGTLYTESDIRRRLGALPKSLHDIYYDVYEKHMTIHRETDPIYVEQAETIFHLLLNSRHTWRLNDMANLFDPSEDLANSTTEKIMGLTFGLVTHDRQLNVLRFAHLSVREYLAESRPEFSDSLRAHESITISCIDYLTKTEGFVYSPVEYPREWWVYHFLQARRSDRLTSCFSRFLVEDIAAFRSWTHQVLQEKGRDYKFWVPQDNKRGFYVRCRMDRLACEPPSTILLASWLGLIDFVSALIQADVSCANRCSLSGHSPIFLASKMGHAEVVSILLQHITRDKPGVFEDAALCEAVKNGHARIIEQFLSSGYNLRKRAEIHGGEHLVWLAVKNGHEGVLAQLLEAGASPHGKGGTDCGDTALYTASWNRADLVNLLLRYRADPRTQDGRDGYAIYMAAKFNNIESAKLLVEHGADINANDFGRRPYTARVERLDEYPIPVSCDGLSSRSEGLASMPLFAAVDRDHVKMVAFLLDCGADPVPRYPEDRRIFSRAMEKRTATGLQILALNTNLNDLNLQCIVSTIDLAGEQETLARVDLRQLDADSKAVSSALNVASQKGYAKLLTTLIDYVMARNFGRGVFVSALLDCARHQKTAEFKIIWDIAGHSHGCPITEKNWHKDQHVEHGLSDDPDKYNSWYPLLLSLIHTASKSESIDILNIVSKARMQSIKYQLNLFQQGDEIPSRHEWLTETLVLAAEKGRPEELRLLLGAGADPNTYFDQTSLETPVNAAIHGQHKEALTILLEHGADPNLQLHREHGYYTRHPLLAATRQPKVLEILALLFEHGASVSCRLKQDPSWLKPIEKDGGYPEDQIVLTKAIVQALHPFCHLSCPRSSASSAGLGLTGRAERGRTVELLLKHNTYPELVPRALVPAFYDVLQAELLDFEALQSLLAYGVDINVPYGSHIAPLAALVELAEGPLDLKAIELLLGRGARANAGSYSRKSCLQCAVSKPPDSPRERIVEILIQHGADLEARHFDGATTLQFACQERGDERMVTFLLSKGVNVNAQGGRLGNALQAVCYKNPDLKVVECLLQHGADVNARGGKFGTALQAACMSSRPVPLMRLLHAHGADVNAQGGRFGCVLQAACYVGEAHIAVVEYALHMGADVNLTGGRYGHALICACMHRNNQAVELLLDHGADITYTHDVYGNALHAACMAGNHSIAQRLLRRDISADERGGIYDHAIFAALFHLPRNTTSRALGPVASYVKQPNIQHPDFGTPLIAAVVAGDRHSVRALLARGADANLQGGTYGTALQAAAAHTTKAMVSLLLKHGAKVNTLGGRYGTALQAASARTRHRFIVEPRSSDNKESTDGAASMSSTEVSDDDVFSVESSSTYRDSSTIRGRQRNEPKYVEVNVLAIVRFLLEHGADINAEGGDYGTALHTAIHLQHEDVAKVLFAHGARSDDHILSCFDERSGIQCHDRFVSEELRSFEDLREGERDSYAYRPSNWDQVGWRERRTIDLEEDNSDKEKGEFRCGTGMLNACEERERRRKTRKAGSSQV